MTKLGYFLSSEELTPKALVETAQLAEAAGFERVWVSDHFHPWLSAQGESPFVWSALGAIAATTSLEMTTAVTCPTFRIHPAVIAHAAATIECMAPGRFRFGIGSGEALNEHILGDAWPPVSIRLERLEEAVDIIRRLWTGDTVTHEGKHYTVHNAKLFSHPDPPPPIYLSAFGPDATELAIRIADGWISTKPDKENLQRFKQAKPRGVTQGGVKICWAESEDDAAKTAHEFWGHQPVGGGQTSQDLPMWHSYEALAESASPEQMKEQVACGPDPHRAAEAIKEYIDAGYDEVFVSQMGRDQEGGIRFLAERVLPLL